MSQKSEKNKLKAELTYYYKNGYLKTFLSQITDQELSYIQLNLLVNAWTNIDDTAIVEMVARERRKRVLNQYLDENTSEFITEQYSDIAEQIPLDKFKKSILYCTDRGVDYQHLVKWCPAMMNVELVHKIYEYLKGYGIDDENIFKIITSNSDKLVYFAQVVERNRAEEINDLDDDKPFEQFVITTASKLVQSKSGTESYRRLIDEEMNTNKDVLRKLQ